MSGYPARPVWDRFWEKVDTSGDCWEWRAATVLGYGRFMWRKGQAMQQAHRVAWRLLVGEIAPGLELDHLCRNHGCVNPDHLEPVTHAMNQRRGEGVAGRKSRQTHCIRGHEFTPENVLRRSSQPGTRTCRQCNRESCRRRYRQGRAAA